MKFAQSINDLSEGAVRCRGLGHSWKPYTAPYVHESTFKGYNVTLACANCDTLKHFMLSVRGEYYPATYSYSDNYLLAKGTPYITKEDKGSFKLQALSEILPAVEPATVTNIKSRKRKGA